MCKVYTKNNTKTFARAFAKIEFSDDGRLSICGVIDPKRNGDCRGSCGQCVDEIRAGNPADEWTAGMLQKFCNIWDVWHLNDMHPECEHQRELGWGEQANEIIDQYNWWLSSIRLDIVKTRIAQDVLAGRVPTLTEEERMAFNAPRWAVTATEEPPEPKAFYDHGIKPHERIRRGNVWYKGSTLGANDPRGILCKPCPVCGYEYGHGWQKVEVPKDIVDWLFSLPDTPVQPAWC
ncbi:MAG: hypothetical protein RR313_10965 [Anaerovoracaceae bacterium]